MSRTYSTARSRNGAADGHIRPATDGLVATAVLDAEGRRWTRLPAAWRENAALCQAAAIYDLAGGDTYLVRCRLPSLWTAGPEGLCGRHFARRLECGA